MRGFVEVYWATSSRAGVVTIPLEEFRGMSSIDIMYHMSARAAAQAKARVRLSMDVGAVVSKIETELAEGQ